MDSVFEWCIYKGNIFVLNFPQILYDFISLVDEGVYPPTVIWAEILTEVSFLPVVEAQSLSENWPNSSHNCTPPPKKTEMLYKKIGSL